MKTSFYFVLWIAIYPLIALIKNQAVQDYSFMVALVIVFIVSMALNKLMFNIIFYENISRGTAIMEDIYDGKVPNFRRRITRDTIIETASAVYFILTTILLIYLVITTGLSQIVALVVFAFLSIGAYTRAGKLLKASMSLHKNPTAEECMSVAYSLFNLNYQSYYAQRIDRQFADMLPPRPKYYNLFRIVSTIFALLSFVLGMVFIIMGIFGIITYGLNASGWFFLQILYGTLAIYFGLRDCITSIKP